MDTQHDPWTPQPWRVIERRQDTRDVFTWTIAPEQGAAPAFSPGQFNMLYAFGQGEVAISISGTAPDGRLLHTVRDVGSVTHRLRALAAGAVVGVRGPFGNGWPLAELRDREVIIVAGGLGLAPLRPLIEWLRMNPGHARAVHLLYGTRHPDERLYHDDWRRWSATPMFRCAVTVDSAAADWHGHVGAVTQLIHDLPVDPANSVAVVCGPEVMMRFTVLALQQEGLPMSAIHLSMERHMQCALGYCGHCFYGLHFVCRDGPVFRFDQLHGRLAVKEL